MGIINILDENLINKIAAGEVIERPASIVKELIDNSIDAGATEIFTFVESAGKRSLKIIDNGCGMDEDDLFLSIERHATSKIKTSDDLFNIHTRGFRGEALASIAAISHTTIKSRKSDALEGNALIITGGRIKNKTITGMSAGTEIIIENLFFNTPVRKKFLKNDTTEYTHILNTVTNHSLANPEIHFKLYSENQLMYDSPSHSDRMSSILNIYGSSIKDKIIIIKDTVDYLTVEAYLGNPQIARKTRDHQKIFVNGRCIKNSNINAAVYNAFKTLLGIGEHPFYLVFLEVSPNSVDVNIHPTKSEVRFTDARFIQDNLEILFKKALIESGKLAPKIILKSYKIEDLKKPEESQNLQDKPLITILTDTQNPAQPQNIIKNIKTKTINQNNSENIILNQQAFSAVQMPLQITKPAETPAVNTDNETAVISTLNYKIIGQANNMYIIAELDDKIILIDQHAAHERMLYNNFMKMIKSDKPVEAQLLLLPVNIELTQAEKIIINEWLGVLSHIGFELEEFGANSYLIRSVPVFIGKRAEDKRLLLDLIDDIIELGRIKSFDEMLHNLVALMSCKAAIKAGCRLMPSEMKEIVEAVMTDVNVRTCPHGRPTSIDLTFNELEKTFKRKK